MFLTVWIGMYIMAEFILGVVYFSVVVMAMQGFAESAPCLVQRRCKHLVNNYHATFVSIAGKSHLSRDIGRRGTACAPAVNIPHGHQKNAHYGQTSR